MAKTATARPGTKNVDGKKDKKGRDEYKVPEGGFATVPADFDSKLHKPLKRKDFKDESLWFELRALDLEKKAARMRREGENIKKLGGVKDRVKAKRLLSMQKRMEDLKATLKSEGIDAEALLNSINTNGDK
jgi:hypothetical protein